jgi:hypothetical protein
MLQRTIVDFMEADHILSVPYFVMNGWGKRLEMRHIDLVGLHCCFTPALIRTKQQLGSQCSEIAPLQDWTTFVIF